ncbi:hypothetical protein P6709_09845 [Jeotgalibacillus sp. ET6]|uniref:hypothetical protein n=1 Tax=Jeotgalibacillus sp. ET6 TaxID=3037260 RepID=UPI0024185D89|nr:hypothetical protein [Jeotgalibacillus sp. ET6]MDG5472053.1 hypothetical protein [Jeotgalibacillus sp. ET6]
MFMFLVIVLCAGAGLFLVSIDPLLGLTIAGAVALGCLFRVIDLLEDIHKELVHKHEKDDSSYERKIKHSGG